MPFEFVAEGKAFTESSFREFYAHHKEVKERDGIKYAFWSMDFVDLDAVYEPTKDVHQLIYEGFFLDHTHRIPIPPNATGAQILKAVDQLIIQSGDFHHVFLELIEVTGKDGYCIFGS